ncbi:gamma carbonic anhydrase family protein [Nocardioides islandensis]|uniref:Gamma carbonic anhydrase family protein n=1 Tax=Nocardioides islandensis TaxID=433663 RepID=A0A930YIV2_9ACTN|nr:gamma carbonic anhydrase family protein [Nocardioides islandensis]MBF4764384.1 gamma carbonic anhydrase family protein [Nocardioides islandensis]
MMIAFSGQHPVLGEHTWVAPGVVLVGDVRLHEESSIWFRAVLRGDNDRIEIGAQSNIQDGCVLHVDRGYPIRVERRVSVGHRAILHGCTVEDDALIGMGAIVMNGARIGAGSIVGAGAVVSAGTDVPPRSLVLGVPGRIKGSVTDEQLDGTRANARDYVALARSMASLSKTASSATSAHSGEATS